MRVVGVCHSAITVHVSGSEGKDSLETSFKKRAEHQLAALLGGLLFGLLYFLQVLSSRLSSQVQ